MPSTSPFTFVFHDYETFGSRPAYDRPAQFAAIRTDEDLNPIGQNTLLYCQPSNDYLPEPQAVLITGITPQLAYQNGVNEAEFAKVIYQLFSQPNSCILGYNNIRFDDEVTRYLFYRNFYDPYAYSWQKGNSRWDLLDVVRTCYALRPEGINWPINEQGVVSFKLEELTKANHIHHENAHDALADVYATIALAKLIKTAQPKLFQYLFDHRQKSALFPLIQLNEMTPLVHISGMLGSKRNNISIVAPIIWHPQNKNAIVVCDLLADIEPLLTLDSEQLRQRLYTAHSELADHESPVPLKLVHLNKSPILLPLNVLRHKDSLRLNIDSQYYQQHWQQLTQYKALREKVYALFDEQPSFTYDDADQQLYQGFFSDADKNCMPLVHSIPLEQLEKLQSSFADPRLKTLLFRYQARNYPQSLSEQQQQQWQQYRKEKLTTEKLSDYLTQLEQLTLQHQANPEKLKLIQALYHYAEYLYQ